MSQFNCDNHEVLQTGSNIKKKEGYKYLPSDFKVTKVGVERDPGITITHCSTGSVNAGHRRKYGAKFKMPCNTPGPVLLLTLKS